ncbi:hypothetical protein B0T26DRAFT_674977 [Lasiosphaeria miniovina]|uniref:Protein kinase domain-containing protein n=1 Tax=Lasiosphaeria miniovina TaxID=1954250 RepID=A0AA40AWR1_9PEZI|nr:uncharacterized protein B0T26DRAFT_674977 [Lasiosphaeria miniovina]KAK0723404.1 hypothetical protein B0T26DRAFT_674977 [Lasiosphaeria miniovina]
MDELFSSGNNEIESNFSTRKQYWPGPLIDRLVEENRVRQELDEAKEKYGQDLVDYIFSHGKKLFVIAAAADSDPKWLLNVMKLFMANRLKDSDLSAEVGPSQCLSKERLEPLTKLDPKLWARGRVHRFCEMQWRIVVPVFSTEKDNYDFDGRAILPFTKEKSIDSGAFSKVHKVQIQEGHFQDPSCPKSAWPKSFAVKQIVPPDPIERERIASSWANEAQTLRKMNIRHKEHILRFITAFTRLDDGSDKLYYLLFEWADGGCLNDLFATNPRPALTDELVKHTATQLLGLAEALEATHELEIRHGDVKPANILHFQPTKHRIIGTLKIGDWGLAKYHPDPTVMRLKKGQPTDTRFGTTAYEPPEVELADVKYLSRQYDVWSMGCVILEIIIWLVYGFEGVKNFRTDVQGPYRESVPFYVIEEIQEGTMKARAKLQETVEEWMDFIAQEPVCDGDTALGELLTLVRKKLLVVELPPDMGQTVYVKNWEPDEPRSSSSLGPQAEGVPRVSIRAPTATGDKLVGIQRHRATSAHLVDALGIDGGILDGSDRSEYYWLREGVERRAAPRFYRPTLRPAQDRSGHLMAQYNPPRSLGAAARGREDISGSMGLLAIQDPIINYTHPELDDKWEIHTDERFASKVMSRIKDLAGFTLPKPRRARLCDSCKKLDFFRSLGFSVEYGTSDLEVRSKDCDLCALFLKTAKKHDRASSGKIQFDKERSWLRFNNAGPPVLSICRSLDSRPRPDIYLGLPTFPDTGSQTHFEIIRQWLWFCDENHSDCRSSASIRCMPTRVIDVGHEGDRYVSLWETGPQDKEQYVALSHPWGHEPHFVTDVQNLEQHKQGIMLSRLPATFRDAIHTTRALRIRYLWIDSICIIQGPGGDFHVQAKQMETVFSSAYCVLAASRAHNQVDGFLLPRRQRDYVALAEADGSPFYVCENIDDFSTDVLNGHLNKRGWVLQEHALARRTVFFTQGQTYFECGDGVRCETLTKMSNNLAAFLGDPNFPRIVMAASQGEKIIRLQDLYKRYSALGFTRDNDRAIAMEGIHRRLLHAFHADGGYGILDEGSHRSGLLRRNLLWHRPASSPPLARIRFPRRGGGGGQPQLPPPPSWSWMAYTGPIDFLRLKFGEIDWMEIRSPWSERGVAAAAAAASSSVAAPADADALSRTGGSGSAALWGRVRDIVEIPEAEKDGRLFCDTSDENGARNGSDRMQCVVLGVEKGSLELASRHHYFILVRPVSSPQIGLGGTVYERVGAGYLLGKYIEEGGQEAQIC